MSVVSLQLGQCGNQLGEQFFDALFSEAERARPALASAVKRGYFTEGPAGGWRARGILVDTEPRVVQRCLEGHGDRWSYNRQNTLWRQGGAGNNWAHGFNHYGPLVADEVLDRVRREAERCDRLDGLLAFHSVAGGTGSGLGSYTLQLLRDAFPSATLTSICVWPFESGEISVQSYNAVLSTTTAYELADMIVLCENQRYLDICRLTLQENNPSMATLNSAIAAAVLPALMPCRNAAGPVGAPSRPLLRLAGHLCAHPLYRLVTARFLPQVSRGAESFAADSWLALQRRMVQMCDAGSTVDMLPAAVADPPPPSAHAGRPASALDGAGTSAAEEGERRGDDLEAGVGPARRIAPAERGPCKSVASAAFLWGAGAMEATLDTLRKLPVWRLSLDPLQVNADPHNLGSVERSLGLLSNCQTVLPAIGAAGARATMMLQAGAYVHQYERHGIGREEMSDALLAFMQVCHDYESLS